MAAGRCGEVVVRHERVDCSWDLQQIVQQHLFIHAIEINILSFYYIPFFHLE